MYRLKHLITLSLIVAPTMLASQRAVLAETRCEVKTQTCMDVRFGPRICQVTICKDELGTIVSTDVVVIVKDGGQTPVRPGPKLQPPQVRVEGLKQ